MMRKFVEPDIVAIYDYPKTSDEDELVISLYKAAGMEMPPGKTSRQMVRAERGAVYVWPNRNLDYPRNLARHLGRDDLEIVSFSWVERGEWRGREIRKIVVDHAVYSIVLSEIFWDELDRAKRRINQRWGGERRKRE